jgi:hypothetical protein
LRECTPARSRRKWWAFEGFTEVDCYLETDKLVLFIEGKRDEALAGSTQWYPGRNQLVRNLEAIEAIARGRACGVLLVSERPIVEPSHEMLARSLPHLSELQRLAVRRRYLGQTSWRALCEALHVPFASLPDDRTGVDLGSWSGTPTLSRAMEAGGCRGSLAK